MNLHISKSKNAESFYICKSFVKANGSTSSMIVRKLGTLEQLLVEHGPTRDDVLAWAKNEVMALSLGGIYKLNKIDTDFPNKRMQHILEKNGLSRCGIIVFQESGKPAYNKVL